MSSNDVGPDRIIPCDNLTTWERGGCVRLRVDESEGAFRSDPVSVPTFFRRTAEKHPRHTAMAVKRGGQWVKWTYEQYYK